jgi:hypothetical protein
MAWIEVRTSGIELPVHLLDQLEAHLADAFVDLLGDEIRSDIRINLWAPMRVMGGELGPMQDGALIETVMGHIRVWAGGQIPEDTEPRVEFIIIPESAREEIEKQIVDHRHQIAERRRAIERYEKTSPSTVALLQREIERLEGYIEELQETLRQMPKDDPATHD